MSRTGRPLALIGALALLISAFLPWTASGRTGIDVGLLSLGDELAQPTVGLVLIVLAALPAVAALVDDHGWPRGIAALLAGALVIVWLAQGPDGALTAGTGWAMAAVGTLLVASAVASPAARATARYPDRGEWSEADGPVPPGAITPAPTATAEPTRAEDREAEQDQTPGDTGSRVLPFTPSPTVEAWGPTRAACFGATVLGVTGTVIDHTLLQGSTTQVAVRISGDDDARTLLDLVDRTTALLRDGRVPVGADLFDTDGTTVVGYLEVAELPTDASARVSATGRVGDAIRAEVEADGSWRATVTLR